MKKLTSILLSLLLLTQACTALAGLPDDCTMHDVYDTWSKT